MRFSPVITGSFQAGQQPPEQLPAPEFVGFVQDSPTAGRLKFRIAPGDGVDVNVYVASDSLNGSTVEQLQASGLTRFSGHALPSDQPTDVEIAISFPVTSGLNFYAAYTSQ